MLETAYARLSLENEEYAPVALALYQYEARRQLLEDIMAAADPARREETTGYSRNPSTLAFRCLGSIRNPEVKQIMEDSLLSPSEYVRSVAAASLLLVQGGKSTALVDFLRQHVSLRGPMTIDSSLGFQMAAKLDDPVVNAAGLERDRLNGGKDWNYHGVKRKDWPVYSWADDLLILP
jgi:hypothetical protein